MHSNRKKHSGKRADTFRDQPCKLCHSVDEEDGLVCDVCDGIEHYMCMPIDVRIEGAAPSGRWLCMACRSNSDTCFKPCEACGVCDSDAEDVVECRRCGRVSHLHCLDAAAHSTSAAKSCSGWKRYDLPSLSNSTTAERWFCSSLCLHEANHDARIQEKVEELWGGIDMRKEEIGGIAKETCEHLLQSNGTPLIFCFSTQHRSGEKFALYIPVAFPGKVFEVVNASSTSIFDAVNARVSPRGVYLITGTCLDMPDADNFCKSFTPLSAYVGHTDGWKIPSGYLALVPQGIKMAEMSTCDIPREVLSAVGREFDCKSAYPRDESSISGQFFTLLESHCGLGGWTDGAQRSGFLHRCFGVESDKDVAGAFAEYHAKEKNTEIFVSRVESLLGEEGHPVKNGSDAERLLNLLKVQSVDVFAGSPLCEGFTSLNAHSSGAKALEKRKHVRYWGQAVLKLQPRYALMEMVPEIISEKHKAHISSLLLLLAREGYQLQSYLLRNSAFGAASSRERFVLVATRSGTPIPPVPQATHADCNATAGGVRWAFSQKGASGTRALTRDFMSGLPPAVTLKKVLENVGPPTALPRKVNEVGNLHAVRIETPRKQALMDALPLGKDACYATIPAQIRRQYPIKRWEANLSALGRRGYRRLDPDKPACSPTKSFCPEGFQGRVMHPTENRVLTPMESLVSMGFAKEKLSMETKLGVGHRMAGNAFSPLVSKAIFEALSKSHKRRILEASSDQKTYPWDPEVKRRRLAKFSLW